MDAKFDCIAQGRPRKPFRWSRRRVAEKLTRFATLDSPWTSPRRIAGQLHTPTRTLSHWIRRERALIESRSWPKPVARFLETPEGLDFLHRLFTAALLVFVEANDCGLRNLSWFLHLRGCESNTVFRRFYCGVAVGSQGWGVPGEIAAAPAATVPTECRTLDRFA